MTALTTPPAGDRQHVPTDQAAPELRAGTISTDRHPVVRYRAGWDCGDTFGEGSDYDGLALTIEVADAEDANAMLAAISRRADLAAPSAPAEVEGLVERLRQGTTRIVRHYSSCTIEDVDDADETMAEAATALTAQQAKIDRLTAERDQALAEAAAAHERAARVAEGWGNCARDDDMAREIRALATEPGTTALAEMLDAEARACAEICDRQAETFSAEEYAVGQPLSSFSERFACSQVRDAILARIDQRKEAGE